MDDVWLRKYRQRHAWAHRAYDRFVAEVDAELVSDFTRPEHVTAVVYGLTQVGKTTLILDLLGIRKEALTSVSEVLRGGQAIGRSSTASPIRYSVSPDENWYVGDAPQGLSNEMAMRQFARIRQHVMGGAGQCAQLLNVRIPRRFFQQEVDTLGPELRLIDIPGINAINPNEQEEVRRIAERYVASADLILLVGRADNLGFLHPNALDFDALNDWMLQPSRFRIVLTYAFSPVSFQTWFMQAREGSGPSARDVQQYLYNEMATHDESPPLDMLEHIYPLEVGDSLESLRTGSSEYFTRATGAIEELRRRLLASITRAASPYARLWSAFRVGQFIEAKVERQEKAFAARRTVLVGNLARAEELENAFNAALNDTLVLQRVIGERCRKSLRRDKALADGVYELRLVARFGVQLQINRRDGESVEALQRALESFREQMRARWRSLWRRLNLSPGEAAADVSSPPPQHELSEIQDRLDGYWTNRYLLSKNFQADRSALQRQVEVVRRKYVRLAADVIKKRLDTSSSHMKQEWHRAETLVKATKQQVRRHSLVLETAHQSLADADLQHERFSARMEQGLVQARRFKTYILEAFRAEFQRTRRAIDRPGCREEQLSNLLYLVLLPNELENMLEGDEG